jgi:hypothetical protein
VAGEAFAQRVAEKLIGGLQLAPGRKRQQGEEDVLEHRRKMR